MMDGFTVDPKKCRQDGICAAECPAGVIQWKGTENHPEPSADFDQFCLSCGHCVAICPHQAFSLKWLTPEMCPPINSKLNLNVNQVEQLLRSRRSIRNFKKEPVDKSILSKLLEISSYAPSAKNIQPWHWLVIHNPDEVNQLAGLVVDWIGPCSNHLYTDHFACGCFCAVLHHNNHP